MFPQDSTIDASLASGEPDEDGFRSAYVARSKRDFWERCAEAAVYAVDFPSRRDINPLLLAAADAAHMADLMVAEWERRFDPQRAEVVVLEPPSAFEESPDGDVYPQRRR